MPRGMAALPDKLGSIRCSIWTEKKREKKKTIEKDDISNNVIASKISTKKNGSVCASILCAYVCVLCIEAAKAKNPYKLY